MLIRYRCWIPRFNEFKYWGFISENEFNSPPTGALTLKEANNNSQVFKGVQDDFGIDLYDGDILERTPGTNLYKVIGNNFQNPELAKTLKKHSSGFYYK